MFNKKGVAMMTLIVIGLIAGALALGGFVFWQNGSPQDVYVTYNEGRTSIIPTGISSQGIIFNNVTLFDSTVIDEQANLCTGSRHGMNIRIYPCVADDVDGKDIQQVVNFTWSGGSPQDTSWVFVYDGEIESGSMGLWQNSSYEYTEQVHSLQWVANYVVDNIVNYTNLGAPTSSCQLGSQFNNTQMFSVTRNYNNATQYTQIYCFTTATPLNATTFSLAGWVDNYEEVERTGYRYQWNDISSSIHYMGYGLLNDNRSYYQVQNVTFQPGQTYSTLWTYTPENRTAFGKWHILGYDASEGLVSSIVNDAYIYIDPWWNNNWDKKIPISVNTTDAKNRNNVSVLINVTYDANMLANFSDLRFLDAEEDDELGYWFYNNTYTASTMVQVWVKLNRPFNSTSGNTTVWMYYDNPAVDTTSNITKAFLLGDDFPGTAINAQLWAGDTTDFTVANGYIEKTGSAGTFKRLYNDAVRNDTITEGRMSGTNVAGIVQTMVDMSQSTSAQRSYAFAIHSDDFLTGIDGDTQGGTPVNSVWYRGFYENPETGDATARWTADSGGANLQAKTATPGARNLYTLLEAHSTGGRWEWVYTRTWTDPTKIIYSFGAEEQSSGISVVPNSPVDNFVTAFSTLNLTANVSTAGSTLIANATVRVYNSSDALIQTIFNDTISGLLQANVTFPVSALAEGNYKWAVEARGNGNEDASTSNRTFIIDQTNPTVNVTILDRYPVTDSFPTNISFFLNGSDPQLQSCFYEFQGVNTTAPNCNGLINVSVNNFGFYTIRGYANDSVGNFAVNTSNASVIYYNVTQSTPSVAEGGYSVFNLTVNMTNIPSITTLFRYNNTAYAPGTQTTSQNGSFSSYTLNIPAGLGNASGITHFWNWSVNLTGATNFTTKTYQQTVLGVVFTDCSAGGVLVYNFTHYEEETREQFNFTSGNNLQVDLSASSLIDPSITFNYNTTEIDAQSLLVCLPTGVLDSTSFRIDLTGSYVGTGLVQEFFYIDNGTISGSTVPQSYAWYDLDLDDSTTFLFTFLDENGLTVPNTIVHTLRYYIGSGEFLEVERSKEDNNGETHVHLVEEDVIYKFQVTLEGQELFLSDQYNAKCLSSPCSITLSAQPEIDPFPTTYNNLPEGSYQVSANKDTREVTLLFNLNQTAVMNLSVWTQNNNEAELVAQGTTTASSGSVTVEVPLQYGNATYSAVIYMGEEFVATRVVDLSEDASDYFGALGLFLGALAVLCLALIGASHGEWVIVWTVLGVLTASILFLVDLEWYALLTFIAGAGIFLIKLVSRRRVS